jgi:hypothetical protein
MKGLSVKGTAGQLGKNVGPTALASGISDVISAYKNYRIVKLQTEVEIRKIEAERDKTIAAIQAQRDVMQYYFDKAFSERAKNLERALLLLDQAISNDNAEAMNVALTLIVSTIQASPLAGFTAFTKALQDSEHQFIF